MTKILISGSYGTGNVGDEVILKYILSTLEKQEVVILSQGVEHTNKFFLKKPVIEVINQTPSWKPIRILKDLIKCRWGEMRKRYIFLSRLSSCDIFWVGGGGLFAELVPAVLEYYLHQIKWANFFKKKVIVMGVGVGPLRTKKGIQNIVNTFENIPAYIGVRDQQSYNNLINNGVKRKVHICPDFAFLSPVKEVQTEKRNTKVIFNFYAAFSDPTLHPDGGARFQQLQDGIVEVTHELIAMGYEVVFLPFGTKNDLNFSKEMQARVNHIKCSTFESSDYEEIIAELASAYFSLTMRFHAGLLSFLNATPSVCIDQQFKSERLLTDFGREELLYCLPDGHHKEGREDLTFEKLSPKINYLTTHYEEIQKDFNLYHQERHKDLTTHLLELKEYLSPRKHS